MRRMNTRIQMQTLSKDKQFKLLQKRFQHLGVLTDAQLRKVVGMAEALRADQSSATSNISMYFGIADMIVFVEHLIRFEPSKAIRYSFSNVLSVDEAAAVQNIVEAHLGKGKLGKK